MGIMREKRTSSRGRTAFFKGAKGSTILAMACSVVIPRPASLPSRKHQLGELVRVTGTFRLLGHAGSKKRAANLVNEENGLKRR